MDTPTIAARLGPTIRAIRESKKHTQDGFAHLIGVHRAYFGSVERGEKNLTLESAARIAAGLQMPLSALLRAAGL